MKTKIFITSTIALILLGSPVLSAPTKKIWVNQHCEREKSPTPSRQKINMFEVDYQFTFTTEKKSYWMYAARSGDGSYQFCTSEPNYSGTRLIKHPKLNFPFVDGITQTKPNSPIFKVILREGNGRNPKITPSRLDLSNPKKPIVLAV